MDLVNQKTEILIVGIIAIQRKAQGFGVAWRQFFGAAVALDSDQSLNDEFYLRILGILPIGLSALGGRSRKVEATLSGATRHNWEGLAFADYLDLFIYPAIYTYLTLKEAD